MGKISVQVEDFNVAAEIAEFTCGRVDIGGLGCFIGVVRADKGATSTDHAVQALTLEHYPAMTIKALARIVDEAEQRWDLLNCTVIHRVGRLIPGDNIVLVLSASAHRQSALEATSFLIDWLKTKAPFWKREEFLNGQAAWVEPKESDEAAAARW